MNDRDLASFGTAALVLGAGLVILGLTVVTPSFVYSGALAVAIGTVVTVVASLQG